LKKSQLEIVEEITKELEKKESCLILVIGKLKSNLSLEEKLNKLKNIHSINLNFYLSKILTSLPENERTNPVEIIEQIILKNSSERIIFLPHNNILFDQNLQWNPLEIYKKLSLRYFLIAFWDGELDGPLKYSRPGHKEYGEFLLQETDEILIMEH
jgi:hypothetical protein